MDRTDLQALLSLLRENGVTYYESGGTRLVLGPARPAEVLPAVVAPRREEGEDDRIDRLAFGRLFSAQGVTRG